MSRTPNTWSALCLILLVGVVACGPDDPGMTGEVRCGANLLPGDLVITEVHANPIGTDSGSGGEFFEIFKLGGTDFKFKSIN